MYLLRDEWIDNFFMNIHGLCQGAEKLCAVSLHLQLDFIALVETHLDSGSITPFLPMGMLLLHEGTVLPMEVVC